MSAELLEYTPEPYNTIGTVSGPIVWLVLGVPFLFRPEPKSEWILPALNSFGSVLYTLHYLSFLIAPTAADKAVVCATFTIAAHTYTVTEAVLFSNRIMKFYSMYPKKKRKVRVLFAAAVLGGGTYAAGAIGRSLAASSTSDACEFRGASPAWRLPVVVIALGGAVGIVVMGARAVYGFRRDGKTNAGKVSETNYKTLYLMLISITSTLMTSSLSIARMRVSLNNPILTMISVVWTPIDRLLSLVLSTIVYRKMTSAANRTSSNNAHVHPKPNAGSTKLPN